jgi:hypothetical protein
MGQGLAGLGLVAEVLPLESPSDPIIDQAVTARQTVTKLVVVTTSQACNNSDARNRRTW